MDIQQIEKKPMDDKEIKQYLPQARIITDKEMQKYNSIDELFDNKNFADYIIVLYLNTPNSGHFTALIKMGCMEDPENTFIEFFDSYGNTPKKVFGYAKKYKPSLGIETDKLSSLLNDCPYNVISNPIPYQSEKQDIATCGRHCCYRILQLMGNGRDLNEYYEWMKHLKDSTGYTYDNLVSQFIDMV